MDRIKSEFAADPPRELLTSRNKTLRWVNLLGERKFKHTVRVSETVIASDGRIISGGGDGTIKIWDRSGKELRTIEAHARSVWALAIDPTGKWIVSGSHERVVMIWDSETGAKVHSMRGHEEDGVYDVSISSDGKLVASAGQDGTVRIWNASSGTLVRTLRGHDQGVAAVSFGPKGNWIASGGYDSTLRLWNPRTGESLHTLRGHEAQVGSIASGPDGRWVVSGSWDDTLRIWDTRTGQLLRTLRGHKDDVFDVAVSPDGDRIYSGSRDKTVRVWDRKKGVELSELLRAHTWVRTVALSADGSWGVSNFGQHDLITWPTESPATRRETAGHTAAVSSLAVSPRGEWLVSAGMDGLLNFWDQRSGKRLRTVKASSGAVLSVSIDDAAKNILSGADDGSIALWDASSGERVWSAHDAVDCKAAFLPGGAVSAGRDGKLVFWDLKSPTQLRSFGRKGPVSCLAVAGTGQRVVVGGRTALSLWDARTGVLIREWQVLRREDRVCPIKAAVFGAAGHWFAWGSNHKINLSDASTGDLLRTLLGHEGVVNALAIDGDDKWVFSGSQDKTLRVWDAKTGRLADTIRVDGIPSCIAVSDGRVFVGCKNSTICIYEHHPSKVGGACDETVEPSLVYTLVVDGKSYPLEIDKQTELKGMSENPKVTLRVAETRLFTYGGIQFRYPAHFGWQAKMEKHVKQWTLSGHEFVITYFVGGVELSPEEYVTHLLTRFKVKSTIEDIEHELGGKKYKGKRVAVRAFGVGFVQDILKLPSAKLDEWRMLVLQYPLPEHKRSSEETASALNHLKELFVVNE